MSDFLVPDLGEGLEDATITSWAVAVGDVVELNQTLCTVETNKAEVEIPSPYAGRVAELGGEEGETLCVGTLLVRIETGERTPVLVGYGIDEGMDRSRRARAAPKTRKLAADLAVDLNGLRPGSGADGVITPEDVLDAAGTVSHSIPVRGVHARMAAHMSLSRSRIPDAHASVQVDGTALLRLRDQLEVTPFVLTLRLLMIALGRHPMLNATWVEAEAGPEIRLHPDVRLGVAVATERGLVVPVVDTRGRSTRQLAVAVDELVERARAGTLAPAQLSGSTFTVSNFGALGLDDGVPVINYPEAAILGMGSLKPRAVVVDGAVVARPTMTLTCAFDHRVADGAQAAAFLTDLRGLIESPETALLDL
ncbi:branched-chain alpha-keto acid dehydrogenase subunit E2 [Mycolicibacterium aromaticivorans JS19b1 = JCM 16368]|uniref:Dihydrolipoamide acetyltransferase component of pyruvate dehydrogenase complex n=1 Tax=Mycolicibacterium aromaticivorans JS19b1 = JCM 16368 TaxID=1440774 RepID=A0A064CRS4_9MYCO|nr:dihydrolipoamide acetyltransferase family protein [Mycolicibacterium aromaticivorans]KDF01409.1 branched-chain alpha-keto acid dehydrogenase subunit E2 [Mycolicibacterium aromaticivorans JS19b1 = JCM 16368]